jgi:hypothetical protein
MESAKSHRYDSVFTACSRERLSKVGPPLRLGQSARTVVLPNNRHSFFAWELLGQSSAACHRSAFRLPRIECLSGRPKVVSAEVQRHGLVPARMDLGAWISFFLCPVKRRLLLLPPHPLADCWLTHQSIQAKRPHRYLPQRGGGGGDGGTSGGTSAPVPLQASEGAESPH